MIQGSIRENTLNIYVFDLTNRQDLFVQNEILPRVQARDFGYFEMKDKVYEVEIMNEGLLG